MRASLDPDICTRGSAIFPFTKSLEGDSAAPLGVVLQQEEKEEVEAMVCGWRKMAAVRRWRGSKMATLFAMSARE